MWPLNIKTLSPLCRSNISETLAWRVSQSPWVAVNINILCPWQWSQLKLTWAPRTLILEIQSSLKFSGHQKLRFFFSDSLHPSPFQMLTWLISKIIWSLPCPGWDDRRLCTGRTERQSFWTCHWQLKENQNSSRPGQGEEMQKQRDDKKTESC